MIDPFVSATGEALTDAELAQARRAAPSASDRTTPVSRPDEPIDPVQLASWMARIVLGRTRADEGIEDGTRAAEQWDRLAAEIAEIQARGDDVDVPPEWFG